MAVSLEFGHFHQVGVEMISSSPVKMRHSAIFTCPPFPPPTGDQPALNMVGRPNVGARSAAAMSCAGALRSKIAA